VEPFGGGASVLLQKKRAFMEIYNDIDDDVVNLFRVLRDDSQSQELTSMLALTPFARHEFQLAYETTDDPVERARRLVIRSFMGFSSSGSNPERTTGFRGKCFRSNSTPANDWGRYPDCLLAIIMRLRGVCIENRDAFDLIRTTDRLETLFYLDPPYLESTRVNYGAYVHEFSEADHIQLAELLRAAKGMAVISGYSSRLYDELYAGWERREKKFFSDGGARVECLWLSPSAVAQNGGLPL
jgi:DNA adenine methylase